MNASYKALKEIIGIYQGRNELIEKLLNQTLVKDEKENITWKTTFFAENRNSVIETRENTNIMKVKVRKVRKVMKQTKNRKMDQRKLILGVIK